LDASFPSSSCAVSVTAIGVVVSVRGKILPPPPIPTKRIRSGVVLPQGTNAVAAGLRFRLQTPQRGCGQALTSSCRSTCYPVMQSRSLMHAERLRGSLNPRPVSASMSGITPTASKHRSPCGGRWRVTHFAQVSCRFLYPAETSRARQTPETRSRPAVRERTFHHFFMFRKSLPRIQPTRGFNRPRTYRVADDTALHSYYTRGIRRQRPKVLPG